MLKWFYHKMNLQYLCCAYSFNENQAKFLKYFTYLTFLKLVVRLPLEVHFAKDKNHDRHKLPFCHFLSSKFSLVFFFRRMTTPICLRYLECFCVWRSQPLWLPWLRDVAYVGFFFTKFMLHDYLLLFLKLYCHGFS